MRAGPLRDRIRIDVPAPDTVDDMEAPERVWLFLWECAAEIATVTGREYFSQGRENAADGVRIRLRHPPPDINVTSACRVTDTRSGIVYGIDAVLFDNKHTLMTLACTSGQSDG